MKICIIGDSITWGAYLPYRGAWANLLRNYLESTSSHSELYDLGIDRNTTKDVLKRFDVEMEARTPDVIIIAIGTNDSLYRNTTDNPETSKEEFKNNLHKIIQKARRFTNKIVFIGLVKGSDEATTPLTRSTTGKCYSKEMTKIYSNLIKDIAKDERCLFIDLESTLNDEDFDDGLHPNLGGHSKIFESIRRNLTSNNILETK